ncbi:MAG TPA: DNA repair protein RecO [Gammaproteobacteria bacterium]|nr:DNA repair protein RecO [Gammaproteobacteria bacterium]
MRVDLHPAYLLHRRNYQESSYIAEVLSSQHGRVALIAKGAARPSAKRAAGAAAALQPFQMLNIAWAGRGELPVLTGIESLGPAHLNASKLLSGFYMNELLLRLLHRSDPHPELFDAYQRALRDLAGEDRPEWPLRQFEVRLLRVIGYAPILDRDAVSGLPVRNDARYGYRLSQGPSTAWDGDQEAIAISGAGLLALAGNQPPDRELWPELKRLLRALLAVHLGDRPLTTRAWVR